MRKKVNILWLVAALFLMSCGTGSVYPMARMKAFGAYTKRYVKNIFKPKIPPKGGVSTGLETKPQKLWERIVKGPPPLTAVQRGLPKKHDDKRPGVMGTKTKKTETSQVSGTGAGRPLSPTPKDPSPFVVTRNPLLSGQRPAVAPVPQPRIFPPPTSKQILRSEKAAKRVADVSKVPDISKRDSLRLKINNLKKSGGNKEEIKNLEDYTKRIKGEYEKALAKRTAALAIARDKKTELILKRAGSGSFKGGELDKLKKAARAGDKEAADLTYERHVSAAKTAGQTGKDLELTKAQARDSIDKFYKKSVQDFDKQIEKAKAESKYQKFLKKRKQEQEQELKGLQGMGKVTRTKQEGGKELKRVIKNKKEKIGNTRSTVTNSEEKSKSMVEARTLLEAQKTAIAPPRTRMQKFKDLFKRKTPTQRIEAAEKKLVTATKKQAEALQKKDIAFKKSVEVAKTKGLGSFAVADVKSIFASAKERIARRNREAANKRFEKAAIMPKSEQAFLKKRKQEQETELKGIQGMGKVAKTRQLSKKEIESIKVDQEKARAAGLKGFDKPITTAGEAEKFSQAVIKHSYGGRESATPMKGTGEGVVPGKPEQDQAMIDFKRTTIGKVKE